MVRVDRREMRAGLDDVFRCAAAVERWPEWLAHYRWVRFLERRDDGGLVEMAAWRPFGPARWPTRWVSQMWIDRSAPAVRYRHVAGVTRGMDVAWTFAARGGDVVAVTITHQWAGPPWPLLRVPAARLVIGPLFIHAIAQRTLAGIARVAEGAGAA